MARGDRKTTVGWTAPVGGLGLAVSLGGWLAYRATHLRHEVCGLMREFSNLASTVPTSVPVAHVTGCAGVDDRYLAALIALFAGPLVAVVALVVAFRRARAAAAAGTPWLIHRSLRRLASVLSRGIDALARGIDRTLPGTSKTGEPRLSPAFVGALLVIIASYGVFNAHKAWAAHERHVHAQQLRRAEAALRALPLPAGLTSYDGMGCVGLAYVRCAYSDQGPADTEPVVMGVLHGSLTPPGIALVDVCVATTSAPAVDCPATIYGSVGGHQVVANISRRLIFPRLGEKVPPGAVPVRPGSHVYVKGSEIYFTLIHPN